MENIILSIETTVDGGGISILADEREIDSWRGSREVSKAEDVLEQIAGLLETNKIKLSQISAIVSSKEATSTGGKIGQAIALGLAKSLQCRLLEISVLESLLLKVEKEAAGIYVSAVRRGKNQIAWQRFAKADDYSYTKITNLEIAAQSEFCEKLRTAEIRKIILAFSPPFRNLDSILIVEQNLAKINGIAASKINNLMNTNFKPNYSRV